MSATIVEHAPTTSEQVDRAVGELTAAKSRFARLSLSDRRALLEDCLNARCRVVRPNGSNWPAKPKASPPAVRYVPRKWPPDRWPPRGICGC